MGDWGIGMVDDVEFEGSVGGDSATVVQERPVFRPAAQYLGREQGIGIASHRSENMKQRRRGEGEEEEEEGKRTRQRVAVQVCLPHHVPVDFNLF